MKAALLIGNAKCDTNEYCMAIRYTKPNPKNFFAVIDLFGLVKDITIIYSKLDDILKDLIIYLLQNDKTVTLKKQ